VNRSEERRAESGEPADGYTLGVDGGGSKTDAVILDADGAVVGAGLGGASNAHFAGLRATAASFRRAIRAAVKHAGIGPEQITRAGCTFGTVAEEVLAELGIPARPARFGEHAVAFERAGIDEPRGVALIAGTGSTCFASDGVARHAGAGGWGALLGDEGSGYSIGLAAIRRVLLAEEGRGAPTTLGAAVCSYFDVPEPRWVIGKFPGLNQALLAGFAPEVSKAAHAGDTVAIEVIESAGAELGELAAFVTAEVFSPRDDFPVVLAGGVFNIGQLVIEPIRHILGERFPNARIVVASMRPGEAVARLTMRHPERRRRR
jgi:N-acetylglucosamine kinase-like BadF-type ATPase